MSLEDGRMQGSDSMPPNRTYALPDSTVRVNPEHRWAGHANDRCSYGSGRKGFSSSRIVVDAFNLQFTRQWLQLEGYRDLEHLLPLHLLDHRQLTRSK